MSTIWRNPSLRSLLVRRAIEWLLLGLAVAGLWWGYGLVRQARLEVLERERALELEPHNVLNLSTVRGDLRDREHDVSRIHELVINQEEMGDFVGHLEEVARHHQAVIQVPAIEEKPVFDEEGNEIEPTGPHREVALDVIVVGDPANLVNFLHEAEFLPYLAYVSEWRIEAGARRPTDFAGLASQVPAEENAPSLATAPVGVLDATIILTVHNEKSGAQ